MNENDDRGPEKQHRSMSLARWLPLLAALVVAACGGGGSSSPSAPVARVEILSSGAWLPGSGQTRQLSAQAYDADANPVDATITWSSSRASQLAVDATGRLTSLVAAGSAQITASASGVSSAPVLAFVAAPAAGVRIIDDARIVGEPSESDPGAAPSLANTYQVTLSGVAALAVGERLLGSGDKPLAGRVTAVEPMGVEALVTLQLVPIAELFATLEIEEVFDLSRAEVLVPPEVSEFFDVTRSADTWSFTPRPRTSSGRRRPAAVSGSPTRDLAPFSACETSLVGASGDSDPPVSFEAPAISITVSPTVDLVYSRLGGLSRFIVNAEPEVETELKLKGEAALGGELKCKLPLFALRLPIGGPLAWFFGGVVPVGLGFEAKLQATVANFSVGAQVEASTRAALGWNCPGPECTWVRALDAATVELKPVFDLIPGPEDIRLEAEAKLYGTVKAELGNPVLRSLRFDAVEARIGGSVEGNLAPPVTQLMDAAYASDYEAALQGSAKAGVGIQALFELLGLGSVVTLELTLDEPLAKSPKATKVEADRTTFGAGDAVNVKVTLDPATLNFLPGQYNVDSVQLRRRVGSVTELLATQAAGTGQQVFDFSVSAPAAGQVSEWMAFVTTRLLPFELASLELGQPSHAGVSLSATFPEAVLAGEAATFTVTAVDLGGQPLAGLHVGIEVDGGMVSRASGETDGSGMFRTQATLGPGSSRITLTATVREAPDGEVIEVLTRSATAPGPGSVRLLRRWDGLTETGLARFRVIASFGHDGRAPAQVFYDLDEDGPASQQDFSGRTVSLTARGTGAYDGTSASAEAQGTHTETVRVVDGSFLGIGHSTRFSASATMTNPPPYPNPAPGSITHLASAFGGADVQSCVDFRVEGQDVRYVLELTGSTAKSMFVATRLTPIGGGARLVDYSASGAAHALSREGVLLSGGSYTFCLYLTGKALWESFRRVQIQSALDGQLEVRFTLAPVPPP